MTRIGACASPPATHPEAPASRQGAGARSLISRQRQGLDRTHQSGSTLAWSLPQRRAMKPRTAIPNPAPAPQLQRRVLVADSEASVRQSCVAILRLGGYEVMHCARADEALRHLERARSDVVLVEETLPPSGGLAVLRAALAAHPGSRVIVTAGSPSVLSGEQAMRAGAWYYLPKPFTATQLQVVVGLAVRAEGPDVALSRSAGPAPPAPAARSSREMVTPAGRHAAFRQAVELAQRAAPTAASVLLSGETGTGKELLAQFIHQHSRRAERALVAINCAALPHELLESELFGHCKGAFTGAVRDKPGLLEMAHGGTLFLDEMTEMPGASQAKLLRVMQDGEVRRVGSEATDSVVNVRIIAATNADPEGAVRTSHLRQDLYYRLNVVRIHLPPLRERREDIPLLANLFLTTYWRRNRPKAAPVPKLSSRALSVLSRHRWPGNLRELQNVIECATVLVEPGRLIEPEDLLLADSHSRGFALSELADEELFEHPLEEARAAFLAQFEQHYLRRVIDQSEGNVARAARLGGVDRTTLYRMMNRRGLERRLPPTWLQASRREHPEPRPLSSGVSG